MNWDKSIITQIAWDNRGTTHKHSKMSLMEFESNYKLYNISLRDDYINAEFYTDTFHLDYIFQKDEYSQYIEDRREKKILDLLS